MYTLDAINVKVIYSANGNVTLTKTVINAIAALGTIRKVMSADDVTYIINRKLYSDEKVTVKQVTAVMNDISKCCKRGERYHSCGILSADRYGFYTYR